MPKAVRYNEFGGIDVLDVVEVDGPVPGPSEVLVQVKAAGINPGDVVSIRSGAFHSVWPSRSRRVRATPRAGRRAGDGVSGVAVGDEIIGGGP